MWTNADSRPERHIYCFFLQKMFKSIKLAAKVICDESKALWRAVSETFAGFENIEDYISSCISTLLTGISVPKCLIQIDRSHFVKNIVCAKSAIKISACGNYFVRNSNSIY